MREIGEQGWLGITWPKEYGGPEGEGVYEYLLNEALAAPRRPADRQGRRHHRQDDHRGRQRLPEGGVPAEDPAQRRRVRGRLQRAQRRLRRGVDAAQGRAASATATGWLLNGQKTWTTSAHFAEWYWLGTRTDPDAQAPRHHADARAARPARHHDQRRSGRWATSAPTRCSSRTCSCPTSTSSARSTAASSTSRRRSTSSGSRCSRSRRSSSASTCCATTSRRQTATASRCATTRSSASRSRSSSPTPRSHACSGCGVVAASMKGESPARRRRRSSRRSTSCSRPSSRAARERVDGHRRARQRSCACTPRTHR